MSSIPFKPGAAGRQWGSEAAEESGGGRQGDGWRQGSAQLHLTLPEVQPCQTGLWGGPHLLPQSGLPGTTGITGTGVAGLHSGAWSLRVCSQQKASAKHYLH